MSRYDDQVPEDVRDIAERLTEARASLSRLELDDMRARVQRRAQSSARRSLLAPTLRRSSIAGVLAALLMLTTGAGVVIACQSIGGGGNTYSTTSFRHMNDASWCQYHGPYSQTQTIATSHGNVVVAIVWDCRHLTVHFGKGGDPFRWRFGSGSWCTSYDATAPSGTPDLIVATDGKTYTLPFAW